MLPITIFVPNLFFYVNFCFVFHLCIEFCRWSWYLLMLRFFSNRHLWIRVRENICFVETLINIIDWIMNWYTVFIFFLLLFKGALDKYDFIPLTFSKKKKKIFIPLQVLAIIMTAYWFLPSSLTYFWRNVDILQHFLFSKVNFDKYTTPCGVWNTLAMISFTKDLKNKNTLAKSAEKFGISYNFRIRHKKIDARLVQCPIYASFRLACRFVATPRDHRLLFQSCSSQRPRRFGFITEWHRSPIE